MGNLLNPAVELPPHTDFDFSGISPGEARLQSFTFHGAEIAVQHNVAPLPDGRSLSPREEVVLALSTVGMEDPEIAEAMFLAPATIKTHKRRLANEILKTSLDPWDLLLRPH